MGKNDATSVLVWVTARSGTAIRDTLPATQVLIVSRLPGERGTEDALHAGAVGYLRKEMDAEELRRAVRAAPAGRG